MKVIVRMNNTGAADAGEHSVVLELRMSEAEARNPACYTNNAKLDAILEEAVQEHNKGHRRVVRNMETGLG